MPKLPWIAICIRQKLLIPLLPILISALLSFSLSQLLFTTQTLVRLYKFQNWLLTSGGGLLMSEAEAAKLQKMYTLWNPPVHPFPYFAHSLAVTLASKAMMSNDLIAPTLPSTIRSSMALGACTTICTLGAQRVGEINVLVVLLNFAHSLVVCAAIGCVDLLASRWWNKNGSIDGHETVDSQKKCE